MKRYYINNQKVHMVRPYANKDKELILEPPGHYLSDDSVIEKIFSFKNGEKAKFLWEGSNLEDQSLCNILAFWCGGDKEQMDRLY